MEAYDLSVTSALDLALSRAEEHDRLRPERERQEALYPVNETTLSLALATLNRRTGATHSGPWSRGWGTDRVGKDGCRIQREPYPAAGCRRNNTARVEYVGYYRGSTERSGAKQVGRGNERGRRTPIDRRLWQEGVPSVEPLTSTWIGRSVRN